MRMTWIRTFFWFLVLGALLALVVSFSHGITGAGVVGALFCGVMLLAALFSNKITPALVKAYDPIPGDPYSDRAIKVTNIAWTEFLAGVAQEPFGSELVKLMKQPPVKLADNPAPNAFCTGWNWHRSVVVVFKSLFDAFDWANQKYYGLSPERAREVSDRQVVGVLMHEFGHYLHRDVAITSVAGCINTMIAFLLAGMFRVLVNPWVPKIPVLRNVALFIMEYIVIRYVNKALRLPQAAISRQRETAADIVSAEFTGNPCLLASGLGNLEAYIKEVVLPAELAKRKALKATGQADFYSHAILHACEHAVLDGLGICMFVHPPYLAAAMPNGRPKHTWWDRITADHPDTTARITMCEGFNGGAGSCQIATPVLNVVQKG
jgi:Zn-dependent protease with chaperone function